MNHEGEIKRLYSLEMNETTRSENSRIIAITRVPGGWVYEFHGLQTNQVFIPFVDGSKDYRMTTE